MKNILKTAVLVAASAFMAVACSKSESGDMASPSNTGGSGKGGSMAKFTISGNTLYVLNHADLNVFDISSANEIAPVVSVPAGEGIETLFPRGNTLFMGTQNGMNIYDITDPHLPKFLSTFTHVRACDPVVADSQYAYVTLRAEAGGRCFRTTNELDIVDISDLKSPHLINNYPMTKPYGLAIEGKDLFVCDEGLKVFEITGPGQAELRYKFPMGGYDVIVQDNIVYSIGDDGLYQYSYSPGELHQLSKIKVTHRL
jgi:hypothetical protein